MRVGEYGGVKSGLDSWSICQFESRQTGARVISREEEDDGDEIWMRRKGVEGGKRRDELSKGFGGGKGRCFIQTMSASTHCVCMSSSCRPQNIRRVTFPVQTRYDQSFPFPLMLMCRESCQSAIVLRVCSSVRALCASRHAHSPIKSERLFSPAERCSDPSDVR